MSSQGVKVVLILLSLSFSAGALSTTTMGTFYPTIPVSILIALVGTLVFVRQPSEREFSVLLVGLVTFGVLIRTIIVLDTVSLIGLDPDKYAIQIQRVLDANTTEAITFDFYDKAALFIVSGAVAKLVMATGLTDTMAVFAFQLFIPVSLFTVLIARLSPISPNRSALIGLVTISGATLTLRYSYWPLAQLLAIPFWAIFIYGIHQRLKTGSSRWSLIMLVSLAGLFTTHKIALLTPLVVLLAYHGIIYFRRWFPRVEKIDAPSPDLVVITLLVGGFTFLQWIFLANYFDVIINRVGIALTAGEIGSPPVAEPTAAVPALSGITGFLVERAHGLVLVGYALVAGLVLCQDRSAVTNVLLGAAAAVAGLLAIGTVAPGPLAPLRVLFFGEIVLISLIAISVGKLEFSKPYIQHLTPVIIGVLLVSQLFVVPAMPDNPNGKRDYLTSQELSAQDFGHEYTDGTIYADYILADEIGRPSEYASRSNQKFAHDSDGYLNAMLLSSNPKYVLYRSIDIYWVPRYGSYRLTWDPSHELNSSYCAVYDSKPRLYVNCTT